MKHKTECPICGKKKVLKTWIARKGPLKGHTICEDIVCRPLCQKKLRLIVAYSDILEEIEKLNKKIITKKNEKKTANSWI